MRNKKNLNIETEKTLLNQKKDFKISGGISKCIRYENQFLFRKINLTNKKLIEFGCGVFPSCMGLKNNKMPKKYIASDTSNKIIKMAKINDRRPLYKIYNLEKKIKLKDKFDIIVLKGVLHHTRKPEVVLTRIKNLLKPNGIILINEPNLSSLIGNFLKWFLEFFFKISMEDSPYGQYDYKKIHKCLQTAKLKIVRKWYSVLFLILFTGDYGRIKLIPDYNILFNFLIKLEHFFFYLFKYLGCSKYLKFKINLIVNRSDLNN